MKADVGELWWLMGYRLRVGAMQVMH